MESTAADSTEAVAVAASDLTVQEVAAGAGAGAGAGDGESKVEATSTEENEPKGPSAKLPNGIPFTVPSIPRVSALLEVQKHQRNVGTLPNTHYKI
eukprot:UC1_evm2s1749